MGEEQLAFFGRNVAGMRGLRSCVTACNNHRTCPSARAAGQQRPPRRVRSSNPVYNVGQVRSAPGGTLMKILVTGGAGFIGSHFCRYVLANRPAASIVNLDKLTYAANLNNVKGIASDSRYTFIRGDVCDAAKVAEAIQSCSAVVHFAAESHVDRSIYDPAPALQTNVTGTFTLLEAARTRAIDRFLHISTDEVYGDIPPGAEADESHSLQPNSPYAASKAAADLLVRSFTQNLRPPHPHCPPLQQLRPQPVPREVHPSAHRQRPRRQAAPDLRRRTPTAHLASRLRHLRSPPRHS